MFTVSDSNLSLLFGGIVVLAWLLLALVLATRPVPGQSGALGLLGSLLALLGSGVIFAAELQAEAFHSVSIFEQISRNHLELVLNGTEAAGIVLVVAGYLVAHGEAGGRPQ